MIESYCITVDNQYAKFSNEELYQRSHDQWQALIDVHKTLLQEHHDLFIALQHPSASSALRGFASKNTLPARIWNHGIHKVLGILLCSLRKASPSRLYPEPNPVSDLTLAYIYYAYQTITSLSKSAPAFKLIWTKCLSELGRFGMAVEHDDASDRDAWSSLARFWFWKALDINPQIGRFYYCLASLDNTNYLHQLYYYSRSLSSIKPFSCAHETVMLLFRKHLELQKSGRLPSLHEVESNFINAHAHAFFYR